VPPYKEASPVGARVRVAGLEFLERFRATWAFHHKLSPEQLNYADQVAAVQTVGFYHGGDFLYTLNDIPGIWHEQCLRQTK
jgi:hypothetical protein